MANYNLFDAASLVMVPSGVKEDKLYSIKPTDGSGDFTFSRGSDIQATRVNSTGNIEKAKENLILQSNQFDTTWLVNGVSVTSGQTGYDGSSDAWLLQRADGLARFLYQLTTTTSVTTLSFYVKAGNTDWVYLNTINTTAYFDLTNGVVGITTGGDMIDSNIESVGTNGWYRISIAANGIDGVRIYPAVGNGVVSGATGANILIQDAQINYGLVAQDYVETTTTAVVEGLTADLPRLDYSGGASCPSLLLEPSRTNLLQQSEYFGSNFWSKAGISVELSDISSPEGVENSYKITEDTSNSQHAINVFSSSRPNLSAGSHTHSCFVKENGVTDVVLYNNGSSGGGGVTFDLSDGTYSGILGTATNATIEPLQNGWYRISMTFTAVVGSSSPSIYLRTTGSYTGDGTSGVYLYGMVTEAGSYPTSYIPTYGAAANRVVEQLYTLEDLSLFNLEQGTFFLEMSALSDDNTDRKISISDGTNDNMVNIGFSRFTGNINGEVISNGVLQTSGFAATGVTQANNNKFAIVWGNGEHRFYVNGVKTKELSISNSPIGMDILRFAQGNGSQRAYVNNKQTLLFPTALTDAECIALTTI